MTTYTITKSFTSGLLKGITVTEQTSIRFEIGAAYKGAVKSSSYTIISCQEN
jgi:hypothetical protein